MNTDLCYLPAVEAIRLFNTKQLSPVELLQAIINKAEKVEPNINAFACKYFEEAMENAKAAERTYLNGNARELEGIPVAIKDESEIAGKIAAYGSLLMKDNVSKHTDPVPQRLLDAGAIVHAKTTTPEFSASFVTFSKLWGVTRNPWNQDCSVGGSSGGSGASLAAGTTTLATGSDIAGSIRVPASMNGVIGYKPPYGRVPISPPFNLDTYCHEGPLARNVGDCILMQNVIAGPHHGDIASLKPKLEIPSRLDDIKGWKIAYSIDLGFVEVDEEVRVNTMQALEIFNSLGATVEEVDLGWNKQCATTAMIHLSYLMGSYMRRDFGDASVRDQLTDNIRSFLDLSEGVSNENIIAGIDYSNYMYKTLSGVFENYQLLIVPTVTTTNIPADFDYSKDQLKINGKMVDPLLGLVMSYPFNTLSRCPVLNMPSGHASNNIPTGIQIVGHSYNDISVFQAGLAYETAHGPYFVGSNVP